MFLKITLFGSNFQIVCGGGGCWGLAAPLAAVGYDVWGIGALRLPIPCARHGALYEGFKRTLFATALFLYKGHAVCK